MRRRTEGHGAVLLVATLLLGCATPRLHPTLATSRGDAPIETTLLLVGDAGGTGARHNVVLDALAGEIAARAASTDVVFLGDNIYPAGLPPSGAPGYDAGIQRLDAQLEASHAARSRTFLAGNHDWTGNTDSAWVALERQAVHLTGRPGARWAPAPGCPGPEVNDVGMHLRLVMLDSEWWLRRGGVPAVPTGRCDARTPREVETAMQHAVRSAAGRSVVVLAHHPPVSAGPHGGHFSWREHLFPLRGRGWAGRVPLPLVGSAVVFLRRHGVSRQDQSHVRYRAMIAAWRAALRGSDVALFVAGHEHQLAVLPGERVGARYVVVSGAGTAGNESFTARVPRTQYAESTGGFMRLDVRTDGSLRLEAVTVDARGRVRRPYQHVLR